MSRKPKNPIDTLLDLPKNPDSDHEHEISDIILDELEFDDETHDGDDDHRHFTDDELFGE
jgi:hypothetical protein